MKKLMISAAVVAALAGSAYSLTAFAAPDAEPGPAQERMADRGFLFDAKLAGMKAALKLTPEQEKLWPAFEAAVHEAQKARMEAMKQMRDEREGADLPSPIAMMSEMSDHLAKASQEIKKVADAAKPLYDSLDDGQKAHFGPLLHMLREGGPHPGGWGPMMGGHGPHPL